MDRRSFLAVAAAALQGAQAQSRTTPSLKLSVFSKHLQWAAWPEMAQFAKEAGFDGVDLTVRKGGHILPERVSDDLPRAVEVVRSAGLEVPMITAGIVDTTSPHAEAIVRTAGALGIRYYRWGGFVYRDGDPIPSQLAALRARVKDLAAMNEHYNITAMYHTHSGMEVGAPIWDLWEILREFSPRWVGINYDIGHATAEGGYGGWIRSFQLSRPYLHGIALKDFLWARNPKGEWTPDWKPAGTGMVNFRRFFAMVKEAGFQGPVQVHYEYGGLGGADAGTPKLGIPKPELLAKFRQDLTFYRAQMHEAGLV